MTKGVRFRPSHGQRLRLAIEEAVGGLESLRALAEAQLRRVINAAPKR